MDEDRVDLVNNNVANLWALVGYRAQRWGTCENPTHPRWAHTETTQCQGFLDTTEKED